MITFNIKLQKLYTIIKEKIKNKPYLFTFITALIVLFIPILILLLYYIGDNTNVIINTSLSVGDALGFYSSLLSSIGTVLLGYIAIRQNDKAYKINKRLTDIEVRRDVLERQPFVIVNGWDYYMKNQEDIITSNMDNSHNEINIQIDSVKDENGICACLAIEFNNTSNTYTMLSYFGCKIYDDNKYIKSWSNTIAGRTNSKLHISVGQKGTLVFYSDIESMAKLAGKKIELELILQNQYSQSYKETIDIWVTSIHNDPKNCFAVLHPQNYRIENLTLK